MSAQELLTLLEGEFPGSRYEVKPKPVPQPKAAVTTPMCARLPPKRVELPALGGSIEILYEWDSEVER